MATFPSPLVHNCYIYDDFSTGAHNSWWNEEFSSNWGISLVDGTYLAIRPDDGGDAFDNLLPSSSNPICGDFILEFQQKFTRSTPIGNNSTHFLVRFDSNLRADMGYGASPPPAEAVTFKFSGVTEEDAGKSYTQYGSFRGRIIREGSTIRAEYNLDDGSGWKNYTKTEVDSTAISYITVNGNDGNIGFNYIYLQANCGLPYSTNLVSDFSGTPRVGDAPLTVNFSENSIGCPSIFTWDFGDSNVQQTNNSTIQHIYSKPGVYTVSLTVEDLEKQATETKIDYIYVNETPIETNASIIWSQKVSSGDYWRMYFDLLTGQLVFETKIYTYRSLEKILLIKTWTYVEFHPITEKAYFGNSERFRQEIKMIKSLTTSPIIPTKDALYVAKDSSIKIDEVKVWKKEVDLKNYFRSTMAAAANLDRY